MDQTWLVLAAEEQQRSVKLYLFIVCLKIRIDAGISGPSGLPKYQESTLLFLETRMSVGCTFLVVDL